MNHREADPYSALRHPPFVLPTAVALGFAEYLASLYRRRGDLSGALRSDLAGTGRILAAAAGRPGTRQSPAFVVADLGPGRLVRLGGADRGIAAAGGDSSARDSEAGAAGIPLVVVPPQGTRPEALLAGEHSVAGAFAAAGGGPVYAIEWVGSRATTDATTGSSRSSGTAGIGDILGVLARAVDELGGRAHVVGCSQGGWLSAIAASLRPTSVASLTLVGAPITFHAGGPLAASSRIFAAARRLPPVEALVGAWLPWWTGWQHAVLSTDMWWWVDPVGESSRLVRALGRVGDDDEVDTAVAQLGMFSGAEPMSRPMYRWFVERLVLDDSFARGELEIDGVAADPAAITCPVRLIAATRDTVVPPAQVFAAARYFSGAERVDLVEVDAGHLELFGAGAELWVDEVVDSVR